MTAQKYNGKRLCTCGRRADVVINTGREEASHITLLCWECAHGMIAILIELSMLCEDVESGVSTGEKSCAS